MPTLTKKQLAIANIKDLVTVLMMTPKHFDMSTVEHCVSVEMMETNLHFRPYFTVLAENPEGYLQTSFDITEDYFFDAINCANINEGKIGLLVDLCIE